MFRTTSQIVGMSLEATDGHVGKVVDLYFDDQNWAVRYIVAEVGLRLLGRKVLLSPAAVGELGEKKIELNCTREKVKKSPDFNTAEPVSRKMEKELHDYFAWPYYWIYPQHYSSLGAAIYPGLTYPSGFPRGGQKQTLRAEAIEREEQSEDKIGQWHLRSVSNVDGYHIQCTDEEIGHVENFIVDDTGWVIRYIVVNTKNILPGKRVVVAPQWVLGIDWAETKVYVDASSQTVQQGPQLKEDTELDREFEERLYNYYGRPKYWKKKGKH